MWSIEPRAGLIAEERDHMGRYRLVDQLVTAPTSWPLTLRRCRVGYASMRIAPVQMQLGFTLGVAMEFFGRAGLAPSGSGKRYPSC